MMSEERPEHVPDACDQSLHERNCQLTREFIMDVTRQQDLSTPPMTPESKAPPQPAVSYANTSQVPLQMPWQQYHQPLTPQMTPENKMAQFSMPRAPGANQPQTGPVNRVGKPRGPKFVWTGEQRRLLEHYFSLTHFVNEEISDVFYKKWTVPHQKVKCWFQNRRSKDRKKLKTEAAALAASQGKSLGPPEVGSSSENQPAKSGPTVAKKQRLPPKYPYFPQHAMYPPPYDQSYLHNLGMQNPVQFSVAPYYPNYPALMSRVACPSYPSSVYSYQQPNHNNVVNMAKVPNSQMGGGQFKETSSPFSQVDSPYRSQVDPSAGMMPMSFPRQSYTARKSANGTMYGTPDYKAYHSLAPASESVAVQSASSNNYLYPSRTYQRDTNAVNSASPTFDQFMGSMAPIMKETPTGYRQVLDEQQQSPGMPENLSMKENEDGNSSKVTTTSQSPPSPSNGSLTPELNGSPLTPMTLPVFTSAPSTPVKSELMPSSVTASAQPTSASPVNNTPDYHGISSSSSDSSSASNLSSVSTSFNDPNVSFGASYGGSSTVSNNFSKSTDVVNDNNTYADSLSNYNVFSLASWEKANSSTAVAKDVQASSWDSYTPTSHGCYSNAYQDMPVNPVPAHSKLPTFFPAMTNKLTTDPNIAGCPDMKSSGVMGQTDPSVPVSDEHDENNNQVSANEYEMRATAVRKIHMMTQLMCQMQYKHLMTANEGSAHEEENPESPASEVGSEYDAGQYSTDMN